jgi:hypothetical protein
VPSIERDNIEQHRPRHLLPCGLLTYTHPKGTPTAQRFLHNYRDHL